MQLPKETRMALLAGRSGSGMGLVTQRGRLCVWGRRAPQTTRQASIMTASAWRLGVGLRRARGASRHARGAHKNLSLRGVRTFPSPRCWECGGCEPCITSIISIEIDRRKIKKNNFPPTESGFWRNKLELMALVKMDLVSPRVSSVKPAKWGTEHPTRGFPSQPKKWVKGT